MNLKNIAIALGVGTAGVLTACSGANGNNTESGLDIAKFDTIVDNKPVKLYTLKNKEGMEVCVTNYGARIVSVMAQDKNGAFRDVVLGYDNISQYVNADKNEVYDVNEQATNDSTLVLSLSGDAKSTVTYTLTSENTLDVKIEATTDSVANAGNCQFNLSGDPSVAGTNMVLYVNADNYSPVDSTLTATGEVRSVYGNQFDFRQAKALYTCIADTAGYNGIQVRYASGFDHNWCLNSYKDGKGDDNKVAASLYSPDSGIFMQVYTNESGMQCATANDLDGKTAGKRGIAYPQHAAVSFAAQKCPVAPKKKSAKEGDASDSKLYRHIVYKFSVK